MIEITAQLAAELQGVEIEPNLTFNPIEIDGKWYISEVEYLNLPKENDY